MAALTDIQRRVLGHLPAYRTQAEFDQIDADREEAERRRIAEAEGQDFKDVTLTDETRPAAYPRSRTVEDLTAVLHADPHTPLGEDNAEEVESVLEELQEEGLTRHAGGKWAMTTKGLSALMDG